MIVDTRRPSLTIAGRSIGRLFHFQFDRRHDNIVNFNSDTQLFNFQLDFNL